MNDPPCIRYGPWTVDYRPWTIDHGLSTMDYRPWTIDHGLLTMDYRLKTTDYRLTTMNSQLSTMHQHYQIIDSFFDSFDLTSSIKLLRKTIKTADSDKIWKGVPANALYFTSRLEDLIIAVFDLVQQYNYKDEVMIKEDKVAEAFALTAFETYCGWHTGKTPWDFFPRHLTKKEFLNPNLVLDKFTSYKTLSEWKYLLNDLLSHALSIERITDFDTGESLLTTSQQLYKLLEATHLIEVRQSTPQPKPRRKWKPFSKEVETPFEKNTN